MARKKSLLEKYYAEEIKEEDLNPEQARALKWQKFGGAIYRAWVGFIWILAFVIGLLALLVIGRSPPMSGVGSKGNPMG